MKTLQRVEHLTTVCGDISYLAVQVLDQETGKTDEYILESQKAFTYSGPLFKDMDADREPYLRIVENYEVIKEFYKGHDLKDLVMTLKEHDSYFKI